MSVNYFKPHERFDFSKDTLDVGNPISWNRAHFLKHFFKRVFATKEDRLEEFYRHHLAYYLANHNDASEASFFKYLWDLVERQLKVLTGKDIYDKNHIQNERQIERLKKFTEVLIPHDQWHFHKSNDAVIAQQESEIHTLKQQVAALKSELKKATSLDTKQYINIPKGKLLTFLDLGIKMLDVKLPDGKELLFAEFPIVCVKLICKYFREGHEEIDFDRVRRYFPKDRSRPSSRSAAIAADQQLYEIKPIKKRV